MKKIALLIMLCAIPSVAVADTNSTGDLCDQCEKLDEILKGRTNLVPIELMKAGQCMGYIDGVMSGQTVMEQIAGKSDCYPPQLKVNDIIKIWLKQCSDHPEFRPRYAGIDLIALLTNTYPCSKQ